MAGTELGRKALQWERTKLGVSEVPPGSNRGPEIDKWNRDAVGMVGIAWCMSFQHAAFARFGVTLGGWAGVENFIRWAARYGMEVYGPAVGDLVCFDWNGDRWHDHVAIVERRFGGTFKSGRFVGFLQTIGGNESNAVRRRRRLVKNARFARVFDPND